MLLQMQKRREPHLVNLPRKPWNLPAACKHFFFASGVSLPSEPTSSVERELGVTYKGLSRVSQVLIPRTSIEAIRPGTTLRPRAIQVKAIVSGWNPKSRSRVARIRGLGSRVVQSKFWGSKSWTNWAFARSMPHDSSGALPPPSSRLRDAPHRSGQTSKSGVLALLIQMPAI